GYTGPRLRGGRPVISSLFSTEGTDTVRDRLQDPRKFLRAQLEEIQGQLALQGDFVPALTPTIGVVGIPSAFGCPVVWQEKDFPTVRPCIREPEEIADLQLPDLRAGELGRILDYTRFFREETGGQLPIRLTDIQGPLDNASLMMGHNNFLLATRTHPDLVHQLLQKITDLTIALVREQRRLVGDGFVPALFQPWIPDGWGISISNDDSVMISARTMAEFGVPYFNQLSDAFGGIYIHSCGKWLHQIPTLETVRNLRGLEFGASETPFAPVLEHFAGRIVLACRVGLHKDYRFNGMADYVRQILAARQTNRGLFIHVDITNGILDDSWPETDLEEIYALLKAG
ncbi:MAG TPA: uroporphyrinogen decarboxylase family protein, partial [Anaerolineales bacterium]